MSNVTYIINQLPEYQGVRKKIRSRQSIKDIMGDMLHKHKKNAADCDKICKFFWRGNAYDTGKFLFDFCKKNIDYQIEDTYNQTVKTVAGILVEGEGDCKHYSQFIVGICSALYRLGYPIKAKYRFAIYDDTPGADGVKSGHVFAVITDRGHEIWCDPVLRNFDQRTPSYISHTDKIPPMGNVGRIGEVWDVSGIGFGDSVKLSGDMQISRDANGSTYSQTGIGVGWVDEYIGKAKKHHKKHHGLHIKIHPGEAFKKYNPARVTERNAFLLLLKLNAFHYASDIFAKTAHNPANKAKLDAWWRRVGGNVNKLNTAIHQGVNVWNKHHQAHKLSGFNADTTLAGVNAYIGIAPLAIPAAVAAAAPLILAIKSLLKSFGIDAPGKEAIDKADEDTVSDHNGATKEKGDGNKDVNEDGSVDHGEGVTTKVVTDRNGHKVLMTDVKDPDGDIVSERSVTKTKNRDTREVDTNGDGVPDEEVTTKTKQLVKTGDNTGIAKFWDETKQFVSDHSKTIAIVAGATAGAIVLWRVVVPMFNGYASHANRKRR